MNQENQCSSQDNLDSQNTSTFTTGLFERNKCLVFKDQKSGRTVVATNFVVEVVDKFQADNTRGYIFALTLVDNGSSKTWNCALSMQQLCSSQVIFSALQHTSKNSLWYKVPKDAPGSVDLATHMFALTRIYEENQGENSSSPKKVVRKFPSWQDDIFVVDEETQFDVRNKCLLGPSQRRICIADNKGVPISSESLKEPSIDGLTCLFGAVKRLMVNNYPAACLAIGGAVMSLGYVKIHEKNSSCPVVLLTGDTETGKSTVLRCCMSLFGDKNIRDYTGKKAMQMATLNHVPFAWDDPTSASDVAEVVQGLYNGAGRQTCFSDGAPIRPPIITANFACSNDKRIFSREALVLFQAPNPRHDFGTKRNLERELNKAINGASSSFVECLSSVHAFIECDESVDYELEAIAQKVIDSVERSRCVDTYTTLLWFTFDIMERGGFKDDIPLIWEYCSDVLFPYLKGLYDRASPKLQLNASDNQLFDFQSFWESFKQLMNGLSRHEIAVLSRSTKVTGGVEALAFNFHAIDKALDISSKPILMKMEGAKSQRVRMVHPHSAITNFKNVHGKDVEGKSEMRTCIVIPHRKVPEDVIQIVTGTSIQQIEYDQTEEKTEQGKNELEVDGHTEDVAEQASTKEISHSVAQDEQASTKEISHSVAQDEQAGITAKTDHSDHAQDEQGTDAIHAAITASTGADDQTAGNRSAALLLDSLHPGELRGKRKRTRRGQAEGRVEKGKRKKTCN